MHVGLFNSPSTSDDNQFGWESCSLFTTFMCCRLCTYFSIPHQDFVRNMPQPTARHSPTNVNKICAACRAAMRQLLQLALQFNIHRKENWWKKISGVPLSNVAIALDQIQSGVMFQKDLDVGAKSNIGKQDHQSWMSSTETYRKYLVLMDILERFKPTTRAPLEWC